VQTQANAVKVASAEGLAGAAVALQGPTPNTIVPLGEVAPGRYRFRYRAGLGDTVATVTVRVDTGAPSTHTLPLASPPVPAYGAPNETDASVGTPKIEVRFPRISGVRAPGRRLARASEGRVIEVREEADGVVVVVEPGAERNARVLGVGLLDVEDPRATPTFALVRLRARPQLSLTAEPGSAVTVRIGKRTYGPFVADASGAAAISFDAFPGEASYEIAVSDDLGNTQRSQGPLAVGTRPVLVGLEADLAGPRGAEVWLGAWTATGSPWAGAAPVCRTGAGVRADAVVTGKGLYLAMMDEPAGGALFEPRVECGLADATIALALPLGTELPSRVELRAYPDTLSADFPIAQVQAALLNGRGERLPPDALRLTAQRGSLDLSPADGALRAEYRGAAAVESGGDTLTAAWTHPVGEGLVWDLELSAAADGGVLVALVRARDRQARPLPGAPVRVWLGELALDAVTDARGWAKVLFPAVPAEATIVRAETTLGITRAVAWLPGAAQTLPDPAAPDLSAAIDLPIRAGRVRQVSLDVSPRPLVTGSGATGQITVRMLDFLGNAVTDEPVTLAASEGTIDPSEPQPDGSRVGTYRPPPVLFDRSVRITATTSAGTVATDLELAARPLQGSVGLSAGWIGNFGVVSAPMFSLALTQRIPFLPRVLSARVGVSAYSFETLVEDDVDVRATMVPFDIGLSATERWGRRSLSAGLAAVVAPYALTIDYGDDRGVSGVGLASPGLAVSGGGGYRLGNSELYAEGRFLLYTASARPISFEGSLGGLSLTAGYRVLY